ncbi:hypothetical protein [Caulobacter sp. LjRoot300]|uniref:hypothetical protein n=1 Tax=Caulobacter sp. LjRoot300 TaxID=3342321 RepID=UPI003F4F5B77
MAFNQTRLTAVDQMDRVTQQNAAHVQPSTAVSVALANEAAELSRSMTRFRLVATQSQASAGREHAMTSRHRPHLGGSPERASRIAEETWAES